MLSILLTLDPFTILNMKESENLNSQINGEWDNEGYLNALQLPTLLKLLQRYSIVIAAIVILGGLITMLFIQKADVLADKKKDIMHKILIVWLILSISTLLNLVYWFARGFAGV